MKKSTGNTNLVQTRVPHDVASWMKWHARQDGDTIAGWLRRLLIAEKRTRGKRRLG
jgi:hypothetical protein